MSIERAQRVIQTAFALAGFAIACIAGLAVGNPAIDILASALVAMLLCAIVGAILAAICAHIARERVAAYIRDNPAPDIHRIESETRMEASDGGETVDEFREPALAS